MRNFLFKHASGSPNHADQGGFDSDSEIMNVRSFIADNEALLKQRKLGSSTDTGVGSQANPRGSGGTSGLHSGGRTYWREIIVIIIVIGILSLLVYLAWK